MRHYHHLVHRESYNQGLEHNGPTKDYKYSYPRLIGRLSVERYPDRERAEREAKSRWGLRVGVVYSGRFWAIYDQRVDGSKGFWRQAGELDEPPPGGL